MEKEGSEFLGKGAIEQPRKRWDPTASSQDEDGA